MAKEQSGQSRSTMLQVISIIFDFEAQIATKLGELDFELLLFFFFVVGRSVEETLRLIKAFEHTDKHGEVCPANWQPGEKTIIPNQDDKIKYFQGVNTEL